MIRSILSLTLAVLFLASFEASAQALRCDFKFPNHHLCADLAWQVGPSLNAENKAQILFYSDMNAQHVAITGPLKVNLYMPAMGHGSSPIVIAPGLNNLGQPQPGLYDLSHMHFLMPGLWEVQVEIQMDRMGAVEKSVLSVKL